MAAAPKLALSAGRPTADLKWRLPYGAADVRRYDPAAGDLFQMLREARDFNPDVAKAVDNTVALSNPGYTLAVYEARPGEPVPDAEGLRLVRQFASRMFSEYSGGTDSLSGQGAVLPGLDSFIDMIHLTLATRGAMAAEVELNAKLNDIVDVYPVDPAMVEFVPDATGRLQPGLRSGGAIKLLSPLQFRYVGKDPDPFDPRGRPPLLAALDTVIFQQQFMRELKQVAHAVNAPRLDIKVVDELAQKMLSQSRPDLLLPGRETERQEYLSGFMSEIADAVNNLAADDAFIHWDSVEAQFITPSSTAIPVDALSAAIDKMMISGTKQLPLLLGRNEGATTTHATVQWQVYTLQLKGYQRISRNLVTWVLNLYLRVQGRNSYAAFEYVPHKTSDATQDTSAFSTKVSAWGQAQDRGWISADEAAQQVVGHPATGTPLSQPDPDLGDADNAADDEQTKAKDRAARHSYGRDLSPRTSDLPGWLQQAHYDMQRQYEDWRATDVLTRFSETDRFLTRNRPGLAAMSQDELAALLQNRLRLDDRAGEQLVGTLGESGARSAQLAIEEQLRAIGKPQAVRLRDSGLLSAIDDRAATSGGSIVGTYNGDVDRAIRNFLEVHADLPPADQARAALADLRTWESVRNDWKEGQVVMAETQHNTNLAIRTFYEENADVIDAQAEVVPYTAAEPECADYVAGNPYDSMADLYRRCTIPAHVGCVHSAKIIGPVQVTKGSLWTGE